MCMPVSERVNQKSGSVVFLRSSLSDVGRAGFPAGAHQLAGLAARLFGFSCLHLRAPKLQAPAASPGFSTGPGSHSSKLGQQAHFHSIHYSKP